MRLLLASWLASCLLMPAVGVAQTVLPEHFGVCWLTSVPLREHWVSPVFEHEIRFGELSAETERVSREFRSVVGASAPGLAADESASCTFHATTADAEAEHQRMRKMFRFSAVDLHDVAWTPSAAPAPAAAPVVVSAAPVAPAPVRASPARRDTGDIESDYWSRIVDSTAADDFDDYLKVFPKGRHAPLARLEAKRLRRGDLTGATAAAGSSTVPAAATGSSVIAQADPGQAIDEAVRASLAEPALRIPDGRGAALEHAGSRIRMAGTIRVPLAMSNKVRRDAGNTCRLEQQVTAGDTDPFVTTGQGLTWAGLLPLVIHSHMASKYAQVDTRFRATAVSHQGGPLFPLVAGAAHAFSVAARATDAANTTSDVKLEFSCRVGASGPAAAVIAGIAGTQTELQCRVAYPLHPALEPQEQVYHWFSEAGCFVQDPSRPS